MLRPYTRVLLEEEGEANRAHAQRSHPRSRDSETHGVAWQIVLGPQPAAVDRGTIAQRVDERNGNRSLFRGEGQNMRDPRLDKRRAAVDGAEGEHGKCVASHAVVDTDDSDEEDKAEAR